MPATIKPPSAPVESKRRHPAREKALKPYLEKLRGWIAQVADADPESSARINIGTRSVTLEGWDRLQLCEYFDQGHGTVSEPAELMAHAIALVLKTVFDVERLKKDEQLESSNLYALQAELMLDTALGMALLDETQQAIDGWVQAGRVVDAKAMNLFRHQISRAISEAKKRIADSEIQQAEALSLTLGERRQRPEPGPAGISIAAVSPVVEPIDSGEDSDSVVIDDEPPPTRRRRGRRKESARRAGALPGAIDPVNYPSLTKVLSVFLAAAVVLFVLVVLVPKFFERSLPPMLRSDMPNAEQFESLDAMPPSIYVTVSAERWQHFDDQARRRMIDDLGRHAASAGYTGVLLRTSEGRPVARWFPERGYELILQREELPYQAVGY